MKKYINFRNFGILCFAMCIITVLTSSVKWHAPGTMRNCYAEVIILDGHKYVIATTGAYDSPGICIIHAASCNCNKH